MHAGVYRIAGAPTSWEQDVLAACLASGEGTVASHRLAGSLWRLASLEERLVEVSVPDDRKRTIDGVLVHRPRSLDRVDRTVLEGIPVTTPTRTLIDLAAVSGREALEEALDDALRRGLVTVARMRRRLATLRTRGRPGVGIIAALVDARSPTAATPESVLETRVVRLLSDAGLPAPVRQHPVTVAGRVVARIDLAYPDARLGLEADGYAFHAGRSSFARDRARGNALAATGWRILHITWEQLERPDLLVGQIATLLSRTGPRGSEA